MVNMREWIEPGTVAVSRALRAAVGGHPLVAEALARRGITQPAQARAFLDPDHYIPSAPAALPGLSRAVTRLRRALAQREAICVWGDFDVDGQTATALLTSALRDLGGNVTYHVPNRETEGHGVALHALEQVIAHGAQVILTCDTGISAHDAVAFARSRGVDVIITDHHDLPPTLPDATAIVNPKLLGDRGEGDRGKGGGVGGGQGSSPVHPLHDLPGVGVAYKLAEALYSAAGRAEDVLAHADLAALGIVADLAIVAGDTRYLAQLGLRSLRTPRRLGLVALYEAAELDPANLTEEHISFVLAPRLNAAGRLADATACVELLTTADPAQARIIAADLEALNARRKFLTDRVTQEAEAQIRADRSLIDHAALVLSSPHWPPGIVGIVASRLVDRYGKPVALISAAGDGPARGSARSVEGVDISAAITATAHLLLGYGGHPMAAGFTVEAEQIPAFRRELSAQVAAAGPAGGDGPDHAALAVDAALPLSELSLELVDDLARLAPFGPGNPPLLLRATGLQVTASRNVGKQEEHRILTVADEAGHQQQVVWWSGGGQPAPEGLFDLAYVARASTYRGERRGRRWPRGHRPNTRGRTGTGRADRRTPAGSRGCRGASAVAGGRDPAGRHMHQPSEQRGSGAKRASVARSTRREVAEQGFGLGRQLCERQFGSGWSCSHEQDPRGQRGPLIERAHDRAEPLEHREVPVEASGCGERGMAHLLGGTHVRGVEHRALLGSLARTSDGSGDHSATSATASTTASVTIATTRGSAPVPCPPAKIRSTSCMTHSMMRSRRLGVSW